MMSHSNRSSERDLHQIETVHTVVTNWGIQQPINSNNYDQVHHSVEALKPLTNCFCPTKVHKL